MAATVNRERSKVDGSSVGDQPYPKRIRYPTQRRRLGISAADCGLLLGASSQSIYNWEEDKTRPLAKHLPALVALRTLGKRNATALIESRWAGGQFALALFILRGCAYACASSKALCLQHVRNS